MTRKKKVTLLIIIIISILVFLLLKYRNNIYITQNSVLGVDISHYQGNVDFEKMKQHDIKFVFIKATEGTNYKDEMFDTNMYNADKSKLIVGAYHFFLLKVVARNRLSIIYHVWEV